jgi:hypothetical protein
MPLTSIFRFSRFFCVTKKCGNLMKIEDVLPEKFQTPGFEDLFVSSTVVDPGGGAGVAAPCRPL